MAMTTFSFTLTPRARANIARAAAVAGVPVSDSAVLRAGVEALLERFTADPASARSRRSPRAWIPPSARTSLRATAWACRATAARHPWRDLRLEDRLPRSFLLPA